MRGGRRGSFFFVIDAFIGAAILIFALILFYSLFLNTSPAEQAFVYANDHLAFLTTTQCRDFQSPWIHRMIKNGTIANPELTLAEQALIFRHQGNFEDAFRLLNASTSILPPTLTVRIGTRDDPLGDVQLYPDHPLAGTSDADVRQAANYIAFIMVDESNYYGPVILETEVWL